MFALDYKQTLIVVWGYTLNTRYLHVESTSSLVSHVSTIPLTYFSLITLIMSITHISIQCCYCLLLCIDHNILIMLVSNGTYISYREYRV